ncbi:acyloxyacyl hydrolase-like [Arctopsyche grandis]|uniref:acyloxyacyl hydrolase-like n=1 Tax=Arctopsyche grandis TaxID=121162 RepID=UPI00406DA03F
MQMLKRINTRVTHSSLTGFDLIRLLVPFSRRYLPEEESVLTIFNMQLKLAFLIVLTLWLMNISGSESRGVNGGINCSVCTIVTGIIQQKAYLKGVSIYNAAMKYCKELPTKLQVTCFGVVDALEPFLIDKRFLNLFTPDLLCYGLRSCHVDPGEQFCHLFPEPHKSFKKASEQLTKVMIEYKVHEILNKLHLPDNFDHHSYKHGNRHQDITKYFYYPEPINFNIDQSSNKNIDTLPEVNFCKMPVLKVICDLVEGEFDNLYPKADLDKDGFSIFRVARGSDWRGKDCSDINSSVYPGAETHNNDSNVDHNCNGIWGNDPKTVRPWEDILCDDTKSQGLIYIGDSIGAHFHMPESWMNPNIHDKTSVSTIIEILLDEIDWPELGFFSGFMNSTYPNLINGSVDSIYLRLRGDNLCSHRDYQNCAKNAAMARHGISQAHSITRNPSDKPAVVIYAMMANDICNRFRDTIGNMTTPDEFRKSVMETLHVLDKKLPQNSSVVLVSLIDGSFIYPTMAERVHPLGSLFNNIHYKDLYSWFSCMQIGPCNGWMTPNETLRQITTKKAQELSLVLKDISSNSKFESFKVYYVKNPLSTAIDDWVASGGQIYELIDPIDSTHPTQVVQPLMASALWKSLKDLNILGSPNPNNNKIKQLFGDQGGH